MREWTNEKDLAARLIARANERRIVKLSPDTALFVGLKLMTVSAKPTIAEIVQILCSSKCERACYACTGRANVIVNAYGHSNQSR